MRVKVQTNGINVVSIGCNTCGRRPILARVCVVTPVFEYRLQPPYYPGRYIVAEEEPVPYRTFYEALCRSLGKKPKFIQAGFGLAAFLIGTAEMIGMNPPVNKENLSGLKQMEHVPSQGDLDKLGLKLRTWKESLEELAKK